MLGSGEPCTAGSRLHCSRTAVANSGVTVLDDGRHLPDVAVDPKHLFEFGDVVLHIMVGDWPFLLECLQGILGVGSAGFAVYDDLAHTRSPSI